MRVEMRMSLRMARPSDEAEAEEETNKDDDEEKARVVQDDDVSGGGEIAGVRVSRVEL